MKLEQGQIWKQGATFYQIVAWSRTAIEYKTPVVLGEKTGARHAVSKKEFCRLIKGATLLTREQIAAATPEPPVAVSGD